MTSTQTSTTLRQSALLIRLRMVCNVLLMGLLAACGGSGDDSAAEAASTTSATATGVASTRDNRMRALANGAAAPAPAIVVSPGFYVDAQLGDDSSSGTFERPWRTLARASAVTLLSGQGLYLRCGRVWRERMVLGSHALVDGSVVAGYGDDCVKQRAVISGADDFSKSWTLRNGVWSRRLPANTPKVTQLFIDGQPLRTAQWPDSVTAGARMALLAPPSASMATPSRNVSLRSNDVAALPKGDVVGATIQLRTQAWMIESRRITALNGTTLVLDNATNWDLREGQGYVLQDKRWMLDSPGEFFHDVKAQRLYLIAPETAPSNINTALVEGSVRDNAGTIGQQNNLMLRQLAFNAARDTGLLLVDSPGAQLSNVEASANALIGVQLTNWVSHPANTPGVSITDSNFNGNGQYGIDAQLVNAPVFTRNTVRDTGIGVHRQANVVAAISAGPAGRVEDNLIDGSGYAGIMFSSQGGSVVARNSVVNHCTRLADCAGIYSWTGRASRQPSQSSTVHGNRITGGGTQTEGMAPNSVDVVAGIYIDDYSDGVTVTDNLLINPSVGLFFHNASRLVVRNNRIWLATRVGVWASMDQTDGDFMTDNLFEANQIVPVVKAEASAGSLPTFTGGQAVWFWHATGGTAALAAGRNAFRSNSYVQLQGPIALHAWLSGPGTPGYVDAVQWQRLNPNDGTAMQPARFTPLTLTLGDEQVINSGFDLGLNDWATWHDPAGVGFSVKANSNRPGCISGCVDFISGSDGDLIASQAFRLKIGVPYVYRWAASMPTHAGATIGSPYISRDGTPWDSMADSQGFVSHTARAAAAGERLEYETFFLPKAADLARVNMQLETPGVNVGIDTVSVREVLGYTTASPADWIVVASAPAAAVRTVSCTDLGWPAGCTVIGLDGQAVNLPLTVPAGQDAVLMRADSPFRR